MKFKFELSEKEVAHIVRNFLEEQGHVPEGGNADLVVVPGTKKADPFTFEATVDVPLDITTNLGGGTLTALGHKPKEDLSVFQPKPEPEAEAEPKKKRKRRTKAEIEADKAKGEVPKAVEDGTIKKEPEIKGATADTVIVDDLADDDLVEDTLAPPENDLFAKQDAPVESPSESGTPDLFESMDSSDEIVEEGDELVEETPKTEPMDATADTLFAPQ